MLGQDQRARNKAIQTVEMVETPGTNGGIRTFDDLGAILGDLLSKLSVVLGNGDSRRGRPLLAPTLGVNRTALLGWERGEHRPDFALMHALLRLNAQHQLLSADATRHLFRLWLDAWGWDDPAIIEVVTGQGIDGELRQQHDSLRRQLRQAIQANTLLRKQLAWTRLIRDIEDLVRRIKQAHRDLVARQALDDPRDVEAFQRRVEYSLEYEVLERVCAFYCTFYNDSTQKLVAQAAILTPSLQDPNLLAIRWSRRLRLDALRYERWYCGPGDPPDDTFVGFAGDIFRTGSGEAVANVFEDAKHRFTDLWRPQRTPNQYEYRSLVKTPIRAVGESRPLGVLGFYSWDYCFNKQDLALITDLADLIGELIAGIGIDYQVDYEPPDERRPFPFGST